MVLALLYSDFGSTGDGERCQLAVRHNGPFHLHDQAMAPTRPPPLLSPPSLTCLNNPLLKNLSSVNCPGFTQRLSASNDREWSGVFPAIFSHFSPCGRRRTWPAAGRNAVPVQRSTGRHPRRQARATPRPFSPCRRRIGRSPRQHRAHAMWKILIHKYLMISSTIT